MKNIYKVLVIIAIVMIVGFSFVTCDNGDDKTPTVSVTGVTLNKSNLSLTVGEAETLTATVAPDNATNKAVSWSTSDATKAIVSNGVVTTVTAGTVTITATTVDGGKIATCSVTVISNGNEGNGETSEPYVAVTSITGVPSTVMTNEELTLTGTVNPSNATNKTITWTIKDQSGTNSILNGNKLIAAKDGTVKVTATITNGKTENINYMQDFDITVTQYVGITHTVTFNLNGGNINGNTANVVRTVNQGSHAVAPENPSKTGYVFSSWDKMFTNVTSDLTVTAQYTLNQTPVAGDYTFGNLSQTAGSVTAVTITPKSGKSLGTISNIKYANSVTIPQTAGNYAITFDVAAAIGWNEASGLSAGNLVVNPIPNLSGTITISPFINVTINTQLIAIYNGSESVSYKWEKDGSNVGINSNKFTPTEAGSYTVTVSATGYNSKTSAAVDVNDPSLLTLSGTITISPNSGVTTYKELTATYSGSENVSYQWEKDGNNVGTNSKKYTPTEVGNYTVTVSATGYNSKTSTAVTVILADLSGTVTISPDYNATTYMELTATYNGSEAVSLSYQWKRSSSIVGTNSNKFIPTEAGIYTVTISASGYNNKTSGQVAISSANLSGTITISPNSGVTINKELTATYSGSESVSYQWKKGSSIVGTNSNKFTPTEVGNYNVTVSATGYNSKTSTSVTVVLPDLSGTISIIPSTGVTTYMQLTATYTGSENVSYQWRKGIYTEVISTSNKYTPTVADSYTVTVNATGYNSKISDHVTVTLANLSGTITISPSINVTTNTQLTATYNGSEAVSLSYQWKNGTNDVGTNSNKFTPTEGGIYTVTVSVTGVTGYNSKTSDALNVTGWVTVTNSTFSTTSINAIAYGNGKFVAVGGSGKMATSSDGITWTSVLTSIFGTSNINAIIYDNNKFIAVGDSGKIATSTNGTTWTAVSNSTFGTSNISAIAYGNGKFIAGGASGKMSYSPDGTTWTALTISTLGASDYIRAIKYANNKFVAVADGGKMSRSTDGTTWSFATVFSATSIYGITYGGNKFVTVGTNGKIVYELASDEGTWVTVTDSTFGTSDNIYAIAYGNNKFIAGGYNGKTATSTNGTTWTALSISAFGSSTVNGIAYGDNKFVAVGASGKIAYSTGL